MSSAMLFHKQMISVVMRRFWTGTALALLLISPAVAHRVNVFAYVEGEKIIVEGYFGGNVKAQECLVQIFDSRGLKVAEGKTDSKGICRFRLSDLSGFQGDLKVVLEAGMGHKAEYTLKGSDLPAAPPADKSQAMQPATEVEPSVSALTAAGSLPGAERECVQQGVDPVAMKKIVEEVVDEKIQPLVVSLGTVQKLLAEQRDKGPSVMEIVGGIGWILGIVGVAGYFMGSRGRRGAENCNTRDPMR